MVSVVIPMYNVEKYILDCLKSLENQIYEDFEVIIVDDGSKDYSNKIVKEYIEKTKMDIKLLVQENCGVSVARNNGIKNARGVYICFIDSDDMIHSSYLSDMVHAMEFDKVDMVLCDKLHISESSTYKLSTQEMDKKKIKLTANEGLKKFLYREITPGVGSFLVRAKLLEEYNLKFEEKYRYSEDVEFIYKAICNTNHISYIYNKLYYYRIRNTSAMSLVDDKRLDGYTLMKRLEQYFDNNRVDFAEEFRRFGVARWVWATLWQLVSASKNYKDFQNMARPYDPRRNMKALLNFPRKKVYVSALIYLASPFIYYLLVKLVVNNFIQRKTSYNIGEI